MLGSRRVLTIIMRVILFYEELRRTSVSAIYINNYQSIDKFDFRSSVDVISDNLFITKNSVYLLYDKSVDRDNKLKELGI